MRKFKVEFDVETDDNGFRKWETTYGGPQNPRRLRAMDALGDVGYLIPAKAKITEVTPLYAGYYLRKSSGELFRRSEDGEWEFFYISGRRWQRAQILRTDEEVRNLDEKLDYLGNGDGS